MENRLVKILPRHWGWSMLLLWGIAVFFLLRKDIYGVEEEAARGLLLVWSVVDHVVSPVVALGVPDFRAVFFIPVGVLWTGQVIPARVFTVFVMAAVAWGVYRWRQQDGDTEGALLATGLLLISPSIIDQIDKLAAAPYLLSSFVLGAWLDRRYRQGPRLFGGLYFAQVFLCLVSTTLHPAGLAYPAALAWSWYKWPPNREQQKYFHTGIALAVTVGLLLTFGWHAVDWFANPVGSLASLVLGPSVIRGDLVGIGGAIGSGMLLVLVIVIWRQARILWEDFLGRSFLIGLVTGLPASDENWGIMALMIFLYWGFPLMLRSGGAPSSFVRQRGAALILLIIISIVFMSGDKLRYQQLRQGLFSPHDELIKTLVENVDALRQGNAQETRGTIRVASQWPGRTMLACRCDALPLPPPAKEERTLLEMLTGIDYLIFDPQDTDNQSLVHNLAMLSGEATETIALQEGGVIVQIRGRPYSKNASPPSNKQPAGFLQ